MDVERIYDDVYCTYCVKFSYKYIVGKELAILYFPDYAVEYND